MAKNKRLDTTHKLDQAFAELLPSLNLAPKKAPGAAANTSGDVKLKKKGEFVEKEAREEQAREKEAAKVTTYAEDDDDFEALMSALEHDKKAVPSVN